MNAVKFFRAIEILAKYGGERTANPPRSQEGMVRFRVKASPSGDDENELESLGWTTQADGIWQALT